MLLSARVFVLKSTFSKESQQKHVKFYFFITRLLKEDSVVKKKSNFTPNCQFHQHFTRAFSGPKNKILGHNTLTFFDRDSNLKIYLLPGRAAQKVENHWHRAWGIQVGRIF